MNKSKETAAADLQNITEEIENNSEVKETVAPEVKETSQKGKPAQNPTKSKYRTDKVDTKTERTPIGTKDVLKSPQREGYVRRFVNDDEGRIQKFETGGWRVVFERNISGVDKRVGVASQLSTPVVVSVGGGTKAVLMEIPEELYKADQIEKLKEVDLSEQSIMRTGATVEGQQVQGQFGGVEIVK